MLVNFSWIEPGRVAGMGHPRGDAWRMLRDEGVGAVLTLTTSVPPDPPTDEDLEWLHVPLVDFGTPSQADLERCVRWIDLRVADGLAVVVHCFAGVGRTGTVLAAWLVGQGMDPEEALQRVRSKRPGSVETGGQADAVRRFGEGRR